MTNNETATDGGRTFRRPWVHIRTYSGSRSDHGIRWHIGAHSHRCLLSIRRYLNRHHITLIVLSLMFISFSSSSFTNILVLILLFCLCYRWPAWWAFALLVAWLCRTYYVVITCFLFACWNKYTTTTTTTTTTTSLTLFDRIHTR